MAIAMYIALLAHSCRTDRIKIQIGKIAKIIVFEPPPPPPPPPKLATRLLTQPSLSPHPILPTSHGHFD
jgi:hypothetical protein